MPLLGPTMDTRNQAFQKLKPACVAVSQATLALDSAQKNLPNLTIKLEALQQIIQSFPEPNSPLDEKLSDYIFFPLSHVLKFSQKVSLRCLEIILEILAVLIEQGWRQKIQTQLASQIWILCTLLASEKPTGLATSGTTVELRAAAWKCLGCLFGALGGSVEGRKLVQGEGNVLQVGQTISTALDALDGSLDVKLQVAATDALEILIRSIGDRDMLAGFLPGLVSRLTKILKPQTKQRRDHGVLAKCLGLLSRLLKAVLNDETFASQSKDSVVATKEKSNNINAMDATWFETAAVQIKPALINVFRLRDHQRDDVKAALAQLCLVLLRDCRKSLANCSTIALEALLMISVNDAPSSIRSELEYLIGSEASLTSLLRELLHDWLQSLTRIMQSVDDPAKTQRLQQIRAAYELLSRCDADTTMIDRLVAKSLSDSVVITLQDPKSQRQTGVFVQPLQSLDLTLSNSEQGSTEFGSALVKYRGQEEIMSNIESFVGSIGQSQPPSAFVTDIARSLRQSEGDTQLASFWLLYTATKSALQSKDSIDDMLNFEPDHSSTYHDLLEELYSHSITLLTHSSDSPPDARVLGLALRTLSLRAQLAGPDFRTELIDVLYPVLHTLATPTPTLQRDSITTLNILTASCGYTSTQDLIVSNVDYLTNAVALKLNAFDVSPQAPQVLLMMVKLAGAGLLPYLEDTVESLFAALEDFHGYPVLVELLFRVLRVVGEEGVKAKGLVGIEGEDGEVLGEEGGVERWKPMIMGGLKELLRDRAEERERLAKEQRQHLITRGTHPRQPWKDLKDFDNENEHAKDEDGDNEAVPQPPPDSSDDLPPPSPRTYTLLLRIAQQTQHFLPSASPSLRSSLLSLLLTTIPALAKHENSFLPLINTLWPEITARLDDGEAHVRAAALEVVGMLCEYAKDFMRGRVRELWPIIREIYGQIIKDVLPASSHKNSKPSSQALVPIPTHRNLDLALRRAAEYGNTSLSLLWEALIKAMTAIVRWVPMEAGTFDEALGMVGPVLGRREVREAFERENGDAVWLGLMRSGLQMGERMGMDRPVKTGGAMGRVWEWAEVR